MEERSYSAQADFLCHLVRQAILSVEYKLGVFGEGAKYVPSETVFRSVLLYARDNGLATKGDDGEWGYDPATLRALDSIVIKLIRTTFIQIEPILIQHGWRGRVPLRDLAHSDVWDLLSDAITDLCARGIDEPEISLPVVLKRLKDEARDLYDAADSIKRAELRSRFAAEQPKPAEPAKEITLTELSGTKLKIFEIVRDGDLPQSKQIIDALSARDGGASASTVRIYLAELVRQGYLHSDRTSGKGGYEPTAQAAAQFPQPRKRRPKVRE